ncbi:Maturation and nuclear export of 40S ribosomal subunits interacting protein [Tilletia horrida]|uniref:Maturation and nuclear export of 40S ribosomal subunits interacting protein n=1 Tax=Tilletia horrida TaxID=155126 RepID=A0AAN6GSL4_9BASI|nr:Maturation and nuclear export of 40S ribosomal subunits interacting protein [Tilletia horrida]KAK0551999.1 Maturation and nuclear export of 40S ribosomal subunits interacting protein [Tilletia horrida]KAK0566156.1 Maturation and nuclear export of 40S ribosomal subunits interacting protein [Tilletia horrida]
MSKAKKTAGGGGDVLSQVQTLQQALASSTDLNPLTDLIDLAASLGSKTSNDVKALDRALLVLGHALASLVFPSAKKDKRLLLFPDQVDADGILTSASLPKSISSTLSTAELQVSDWVKDQWNATVHLLCALTAHQDEGIRATALRQLLVLQLAASNVLSSHLGAASDDGEADQAESARWAPSPWRATVLAVTAGAPLSLRAGTKALQRHEKVHLDVYALFLEELAEKYDDARYAFLKELRAILVNPPQSATTSHNSFRSNALAVLINLTAVPSEQGHLNAFYVPALAKPGSAKKKKGKAKANGTGKAKAGGKDDEEEEDAPKPGQEGFDDMEDWFSDSDEEGQGTKSSGSTKGGGTTGLGKMARDQRAKRKRKSALPLSEAVHDLTAQKGAFANAWLALMLPRAQPQRSNGSSSISFAAATPIGGPLSTAQTHQILLVLHTQILPHFSRPNLVHEFLVDCLNRGHTDAARVVLGESSGSLEAVAESEGVNAATALLALHGLYTLIIVHNLDYPDFFKRLYALMLYTPHLLHMRYRSRFLRLLETFMSSSLLPAALVASFAKRLSRMALRASPAAAVCIIPLVWNLLKKHKNCLGLIHRDFGEDRLSQGPAGLPDPFDALESDPLKTGALDSSLWELAALGAAQAALQRQGVDTSASSGGTAHYLHSTSTLSRILAEPFLKERYDLDDFLDITYGTLFENESSRILDKATAKGDADQRRKAKPIPTPAVRATLGDVQLERFERERTLEKEREQARKRVAEEGAENEPVAQTVPEASAAQAATAPVGLGFRGFSTPVVRAKRRKQAKDASTGSESKSGPETHDVMDLWLF